MAQSSVPEEEETAQGLLWQVHLPGNDALLDKDFQALRLTRRKHWHSCSWNIGASPFIVTDVYIAS